MKKIISILIVLISATTFAQSELVKEVGDIYEVKVFDLIEVNLIKSSENKVVVKGQDVDDVKVINDDLFTDNGKEVKVLKVASPDQMPWKELNVDVAIEATGVFRKREQIEGHISAGAKKVLLTVPSKDKIDATVVMGVNEDDLKADDLVISNASCTTNCLGPMAKVINDTFGIDSGLMTTIHAYTNDQNIVDSSHSDLRRARAGAENIIPTSTGAA